MPTGFERHKAYKKRERAREAIYGSSSDYDRESEEAIFNRLWLKLRAENRLPDHAYFMELKSINVTSALNALIQHDKETAQEDPDAAGCS